MGVFKNDVGRPSNRTVKIRRIITTIILLIIIGCLIVFAYTLGKENKIEENNIDYKKNTTSNVSKKRFSKEKAQKLLDKYVYDKYYDLVSEDFSDDYKTILALKNTNSVKREYSCTSLFKDDIDSYDDAHSFHVRVGEDLGLCYDEDLIDFYSLDSVNKEYKKLFGLEDAKKSSVSILSSGSEIMFGYSSAKNGYAELSCECGGASPYEKEYLYEAYIEDDQLHIIFSYFSYMDYDSNNKLVLDSGDKEVLVDNKMDDNFEIIGDVDKIFEDNKDKFTLYEMILQKQSGNYVYKSLNVIK